MAGEVGSFVVTTDRVGGSANGDPVAGGALPNTWTVFGGGASVAAKPSPPQVARVDPTFQAVTAAT
jgi:hypothetical protein